MGVRLDIYEKLPESLSIYISENGPHFNKKLCDWAISKMYVKDDLTGKKKRLDPWNMEQAKEMMERNKMEVKNDHGFDVCYLMNMLKADFYKKSITDEAHLCMHVKLYLDDVDGDPCRAFDEFYATCIGKGIAIPWEKML